MNMNGEMMADRLGVLLEQRQLTVAAAESCTGGLLGGMITVRAGASAYFLGSAVTYANSAKEKLLGVPSAVLAAHGAVSAETAAAMAAGARTLFGADAAVAVTGIAGPGGAVPGKPVGTVFIGVADGRRTETRRYQFSGDRGAVREQTVLAALTQLYGFLGGV